MVNQEILEGLRLALSRGYTLEKAMMSFYNAGYKKEEIEEAAKTLYAHPSHPLSHPHKPTPEELKKPIEKAKPIKPAPAKPVVKPAVKPGEKPELKKPTPAGPVSKYEEAPKKKGPLITILIILLLILLGVGLVGVVLYKNQLINFFSRLL